MKINTETMTTEIKNAIQLVNKLNSERTKGDWKFTISTPTEESAENDGKNCGANAYMFVDGKKSYVSNDIVFFSPHWRKEDDTPKHSADLKYAALAVNNFQSVCEALNTCLERIQFLEQYTEGKVDESIKSKDMATAALTNIK